jgi:methyl-accepting chemotaxis protein
MGLRHAAEQTGAGADSMDAGLQTFAKRLGEAARGGGAASAALEKLGLNAQQMAQQSLGKSFLDIAKAMEKFESPAQRNALAANLFSKANQRLLLTLDLGVDGLQNMQDEMERLGVFSAEQAAHVEDANDAMDRMHKVLTGGVAEAAIRLAPLIEGLAEAFTNFSTGAGEAEDSMNSFALSMANPMRLIDAMNTRIIEGQILIVKRAMDVRRVTGSRRGMSDLVVELQVLENQLNKIAEMSFPDPAKQSAARDAADAARDQASEITDAANEMERMQAAAEAMNREFRSPWKELTDRLDEISKLQEFGITPAVATIAKDKAIADYRRAIDGETEPDGLLSIDGGADGLAGGGLGGPRFAGAMKKGSAAAFSTIVNAGKGGQKIAKEQLQVAKQQLAETKLVVSKLDIQTVSIPSG